LTLSILGRDENANSRTTTLILTTELLWLPRQRLGREHQLEDKLKDGDFKRGEATTTNFLMLKNWTH
jgi:hypothetical protein